MYRIFASPEFLEWLDLQSSKIQAQVQARLFRISEFGHFGDLKKVGAKVSEVRWRSGLRVYLSFSKDEDGKLVIILLGGSKNTQSKDISRAKKLLKELEDEKK